MDQAIRRRSRWSDNDRYFGPFTFSWVGSKGYRPVAVILKSWGSGDDDDGPASLRLSFVWFTIIVWLPPILRPQRSKVYPSSWDAATVTRLGRNWYWDVKVREYGFSYSDGFVQIHYGICPGDSSLDQTWCKHLPWTQWRQIAHRLYNADGSLAGDVADLPWDQWPTIRDGVRRAHFAVTDYDGARIAVDTYVEERERRLGTGWFRWLGHIAPKRQCRSLNISFRSEVGPEKGSWKGGMMGHGIDMLPGETQEQAFRRYCDQEHRSKYKPYRITFMDLTAIETAI